MKKLALQTKAQKQEEVLPIFMPYMSLLKTTLPTDMIKKAIILHMKARYSINFLHDRENSLLAASYKITH
jgi:hypothetical protein